VLAFLADPQTETFRFQAPQAERNDMSNYLNRNSLDVDQETSRTRPAHTLVLTKNDQSYHRAVKRFAMDRELLARLESDESFNPQIDFVRRLAETALEEGYEREEVQRALALYRDYFAALAAGRSPETQVMSASVDALLDRWEGELDRRCEAGADGAYVPGTYPSLDAMSEEAFAMVASEVARISE
jgi:hypothetical protein